MLIDKHGRQRVGIPFEQLDVAGLAADMAALLERALIGGGGAEGEPVCEPGPNAGSGGSATTRGRHAHFGSGGSTITGMPRRAAARPRAGGRAGSGA